MKNEQTEFVFDLTNDLYLKISADKADKISELRKEKDQVANKIEGDIEQLKELRAALNEIQRRISETKNDLSENRKRKYEVKKELSKQNRFAKKLNKLFSKGEETIDLKNFYTHAEIKIR